MQLLPIKMGLISEYIDKSFKAKGYRLGNKYAMVIGSVLK
jgi:hypothetical protein